MKYTNNAYFEGISDLAYDFIENSKWKSYAINEILGSNARNAGLIQRASLHTAEFGNYKTVDCSNSENDQNSPLKHLSILRETSKQFDKNPLSLEEFIKFLTSSYFITKRSKNAVRFNIASAGAMYPTELYFLNKGIAKIPKGIYHYNPYHECVELMLKFSSKEVNSFIKETFISDIRDDLDFKNASAILIFGSVLNRTSVKYGDRGVKYAMIDVGAINHSFYLNAALLNIGYASNGGYIDDKIAEVIGFKDRSQVVLLTALIGRK